MDNQSEQFLVESIKSDKSNDGPDPIQDLDDSQISQLLNQMSFLSQSQKGNVSLEADTIFEEMSSLKDKVLGLLSNYQSSLKIRENVKELNSQIKKDARNIHREYNSILGKVNQSFENSQDYSITEKDNELNTMFNLIEEFLEKFQGKKPVKDIYLKVYESSLMKSQSSFFSQDASTISVSNCEGWKEKLDELIKGEEYGSKILQEAMGNLEEALKGCCPQDVWRVVSQVSKSLEQKPSKSELFQILQKAIEVCRQKQQNTSLSMSMSNASMSQVPQDMGSSRRRRFFDEALKIKSELDKEHPGKKVLVSELYEEVLEDGISEDQWGRWLELRIKQ